MMALLDFPRTLKGDIDPWDVIIDFSTLKSPGDLSSDIPLLRDRSGDLPGALFMGEKGSELRSSSFRKLSDVLRPSVWMFWIF